ncbi:MAG: acyltransferase family protein [Acetobacteraceae bacterium]
MDKQLSRYLDLLRVLAALFVLLAHLSDPAITGGRITVPSEIGYSAVMVFFVLSGYVICYVAVERQHALSEFAISRVARVYSVVLPALALTVFVDILFMHVRPLFRARPLLAGIPTYQYRKLPEYLMMHLVFGNHLLGLHETAFSNGTFWSMCFEVYYYVHFAIAFYFRGPARIAALLCVIPVIGIGPLLRFHLWLFGCLVYWQHRRGRGMAVGTARAVFVVAAALLLADLATNLNLRIDVLLNGVTGNWVARSDCRRLAGDTLTGALVALNIFAARYAAFDFGRAGRWFAYFASFTFSLYLMHVPLLRLFAAYWNPGPLVAVAAVLATVWVLGQVTERQKERLRILLQHAVARWPGRVGAPGG